MNIKVSVALAVLAVSTVGVSACSSSASKGAATVPTTAAGSASSSSSPVSALSTPTTADSPATPTASQPQVRTDIPDSAMLSSRDLAPSPAGAWKQYGGPPVPGSAIVDPDNCDPVPRPQYVDPNYPRNRAWANMRTLAWSGSDISQVNESVVTYTSAAAASVDFAKHRSWIAGCAAHFQWTDAPSKYSISPVPLSGVSDAYAIRVAMYPPDQPASTAGSQGVDYMTVILRGNTLTVVSVSETGSTASKPQDPGLTAVRQDVQAAVGKLTTVFAPSR